VADDVADSPAPEAARRGAGRPRKEPFEDREARLLDEAVRAFATHGPMAPIDAIAEATGINKALVYRHFPSKDALFAAAVRRERDRLVEVVSRAQVAPVSADDGTPLRGRERVRRQFHAFLDFAEAHPTSLALLGRPEASGLLDGSGRDAVAGAVTDNLRRALRARGGPDRVVPEVLAAMFVGMAGAVIRAGRDAGWDAEAVVDLLTDFTLAGLAGLDADVIERVERRASDEPDQSR